MPWWPGQKQRCRHPTCSPGFSSRLRQTAPGAGGELLTTAQMAARLQIAPKTLLRRAKKGQLEPIRLGQRGRGALRWAAR